MFSRTWGCVPILALEAFAGGFRVQTDLTLIDASVVDRGDRFIPGLDRSDFRIFDRGVEQRITSFSMEDAPVSLAVVFDSSGSMTGSLPLAREALAAFLRRANPRDEYCMVTVRGHPELTAGFTRNPEEALARVSGAPPSGSTALFDAVFLALDALRQAANARKAVLVISDGEDNNSRYTELELIDRLREGGANLYAIGVGVANAPILTPGLFFQRPPSGGDVLSDLAEESGGRYFEAGEPRDLPGVMDRIDLRYQYVLGFTPAPLRADGKYHRIDLKLAGRARQSGLRAYWRRGYYAPYR
jgi:Ca-activated chloride channel family protein